ncbi:MAG TPA: cold shock domain-containing protein [Bacteroidales bacterium]|nr:cold shock domain-containing protein [Bacteroidales bacterium]
MGRSQESFSKKEIKKKKDKKRKEKEKKRLLKKEAGKSSFDDMIAYVDEFGMISDTPPDPDKKTEVDVDSIELGAARTESSENEDPVRRGKVTFYNSSKGFGFIRDLATSDKIFVHHNSLIDEISEEDLVTFEIGKGPKGPMAINVKLSAG